MRRATTMIGPHSQLLEATTRVFSARKAHLFETYRHTLSQKPVILFYRHRQMSVKELERLRIDLEKLARTHGTAGEEAPQIIVTRTGILSALAKVPWPKEAKSNALALTAIKDDLIGPMLMLVYPSLVPPLTKKIFDLFERTGRPKPTLAQVSAKVPKSEIPRRLAFVAGLIQGQVLDVKAMKEVNKLPRLESLHGEIIGLIESPMNQLVQTLQLARGSRLVNLLEQDRSQAGEAPDQTKASST